MVHPIHPVTSFKIVAPYTLTVCFADGTEQGIDLKPVLRGGLFGPLLDPATFERVVLDAEAGTLVWSNGADFDPATLHEWPEFRDELVARAREWSEPTSDGRPDRRMADAPVSPRTGGRFSPLTAS